MTDPDLPENRVEDLMTQFSSAIAEGDAVEIADRFRNLLQEAFKQGMRQGMESTAIMLDKFIDLNQHYTLDSALTQNIKTVQLATAAFIRDHVRLASLQVS
jgi:DNA invertase Pin-like site-specific DNA recombinase